MFSAFSQNMPNIVCKTTCSHVHDMWSCQTSPLEYILTVALGYMKYSEFAVFINIDVRYKEYNNRTLPIPMNGEFTAIKCITAPVCLPLKKYLCICIIRFMLTLYNTSHITWVIGIISPSGAKFQPRAKSRPIPWMYAKHLRQGIL